jgi:hypothetical protein
MRVYISGPMSGYDNHNYQAFHEAAKKIREAGYDVLCPAENFNGDTSLGYDLYMRQDLVLVSICDIIAMLPGWEKSTGALCELHAAITIGLPVIDAETLEPLKIDAGRVGFVMWRKALAGQNRNIRQDEEREDYTGILASSGVGEAFRYFLRSADPQGTLGNRDQERTTPGTLSSGSTISGD